MDNDSKVNHLLALIIEGDQAALTLLSDDPVVMQIAQHLGADVRDVRAERDRLQAALAVATDAADAAAVTVGTMAGKLSALMAEQDRLRAVVGAARALVAERRAVDDTPVFCGLSDALDQLDVSADTGTAQEEQPFGGRPFGFPPDQLSDSWCRQLAGEQDESIESPCPSCGQVESRRPYDIGSGPELSCALCEWCWGAEGQELHPIDVHADVTARKLHGTTDAMVWAAEFARICPGNTSDIGTLVGWFANAIEVGRAAGRSAASDPIETADTGRNT